MTPQEIRDAHPKCETCIYEWQWVCVKESSPAYNQSVSPKHDYCRHHSRLLAKEEPIMTEYDRALIYFDDVLTELGRAIEKFPTWPDDPLHALAILVEEVGELAQEFLKRKYENGPAPSRQEAVQVTAMALRLLGNWDKYETTPREGEAPTNI